MGLTGHAHLTTTQNLSEQEEGELGSETMGIINNNGTIIGMGTKLNLQLNNNTIIGKVTSPRI